MLRFIQSIIWQVIFAVFALAASPAIAQPVFSTSFSPTTIGPGGESTLTYTIDNTLSGSPVTGLGFTNVLPTVPGDVDIADPANAFTNCSGMGGAAFATVTAPDGGGTVSFSNGQIAAGSTCTVTVNVTAGTPGTHTNPVVTLSSSAGPSDSLASDLTVSTALPGLMLSAAPSTIDLGEISTLTFTADNTANASRVGNLSFTLSLPAGLEVASPSNAASTCVSATLPDTTVTAVPGTSTIELDADGNTILPGLEVLAAGGTCTTTVDVLSTGAGTFNLVVPDMLADFNSAGGASTTLQVDVEELNIAKSFITNPVVPGDEIDLQFVISNLNRNFSATGVAFTDDLDAVVSGLEFESLVSNDCGGSVTGVGTGLLGLSGGTITPEGSCTIRVTLDVPGGAPAGDHTNTTSAVTGTIGGDLVTGNMATADLTVADITVTPPTLSFDIPDGSPGDTVTMSFTLTNTATAALTDGTFDLLFAPPLPDVTTITTPTSPNPACGVGSTFIVFSPDIDQRAVRLSGALLAPTGSPGDSCTFTADMNLPGSVSPGLYGFTSSAPAGSIGGATRTGLSASDTMNVGSDLSITFTKVFLGAGVPGGTVDLQFDIARTGDSPDAAAINFTDSLETMLTGTTLASTVSDTCGGGATGTSTISYSGGSLSGATLSCTIVTRLNVPAGATIGSYPNTTSDLSATPSGGVAETFTAASDTLTVTGLNFTKEFLTDPAIAGGNTTLRFTIENLHPTEDATITFFTDNLQQELTGLAATGAPTLNECGGSLSGTTFLTYVGGSVLAGDTCNIEVPLLVPLATADGTYNNLTSFLSANQGGAVTVDPAQDSLTVVSDPILFTKEFTNDPVRQGEAATLVFTITNQSAASATALSFSDDLDAMLTNSTFLSENSNTCASTTTGLGTGAFGSGSFGLGPVSTCEISIEVGTDAAATVGIHLNTTTDISGTVGGGAVPAGVNASDSLAVDSSAGPDFSKSFAPTSGSPGSTTTLNFSIQNNSGGSFAGLRFTDDLDSFLTGATLASASATSCDGAPTISGTGTGLLTVSALDLADTEACTIAAIVNIPATAAAGSYDNISSALEAGGIDLAAGAFASFSVTPTADVAVTKTDGITSVTAGDTLVYTIVASNNGPHDDPSVNITDDFPTGLTCAYTSAAAGGASGNTSAAGNIDDTLSMPNGSSVTYTATCVVDFSFTGTLVNTADISGSLAIDPVSGNNSAQDGDTVVSAPTPLTFTKAFADNPLTQGGVTTLTFTITNPNADVGAGNLSFSDNFPTDMVVASPANESTTCTGGAVSATPGAGSMSFSGGSVGTSANCTVSVNIRALSATALDNSSEPLTSDFPDDTPGADATLNINPAPSPTFRKAFNAAAIVQGDISTLTFTIDNGSNLIEATGLGFTDVFPTGMVVANPAAASTDCTGGVVTATAGTDTVTLAGGTVAAGASCSVDVNVRALADDDLDNLSGALGSSLSDGSPPPTAAATLVV